MRGFFFLRHGETDWNAENRMQGRTRSVPLNETGKKQSEKAAELLAEHRFDLIVSSPLERAAMTARIIGERIKCPLIFDERLIERSWGVAEGLTHDEIKAANPTEIFCDMEGKDWMTQLRHPKGAETREALADRASAALFDLLSHHQKERILLVTHGAWLRALIFHLTGIDQSIPNAAPYAAFEKSEGWQIKRL
ncbi:MAG: histidine phosphatase family protein [Bdellovibrionales bacterium]